MDKDNFKSIESTRNYINKNLDEFTETVNKTLKENNYQETFNINYGKNYFPEKKYKNKTYSAGEYESLVITLGEGDGDNFWCVLFPPLCTTQKSKNIKYKSFIKEIIDKYF